MESFQDAFGKKTKRKRPKLVASDYEALVKKASESQGKNWFPNPLLGVILATSSLFVHEMMCSLKRFV